MKTTASRTLSSSKMARKTVCVSDSASPSQEPTRKKRKIGIHKPVMVCSSQSDPRSTSAGRVDDEAAPGIISKPRWRPDEKAAVIKLYVDGRKRGLREKELYACYKTMCAKNKWRVRSEPACRMMVRPSLYGRRRETSAWTKEETQLLTKMRDDGASMADMIAAFGDSRTRASISSKLHNLLPRSTGVAPVAHANAIARERGVKLMSTKAFWTEQEDAVLERHIAAGFCDCVVIRSELLAVITREGLPVEDRTVAAIRLRIARISEHGVPTRRVRRSSWTTDNDQLVREAVIAKRDQEKTIKAIAEKTTMPASYVKTRWMVIRNDLHAQTGVTPDTAFDHDGR